MTGNSVQSKLFCGGHSAPIDEIKTVRPVIISASRATDIPAFYSDWFFHRLSEGWCIKFNPYCSRTMRVDFRDTRFVVFWTKNPSPIIDKLRILEEKGLGYYFQYTLNDYVKEGLEKNVPPLDMRIEAFKQLSETAGKERVVWRFDPLIFSDTICIDTLLSRIEAIGEEIHEYTEKFVFSFIDLYKSVKKNLERAGYCGIREFTVDEMDEFASGLQRIVARWGISAATCAESVDLSVYGISKNRCIDPDLIEKISANDPGLLRYLEKNSGKDPGQRPFCGCIRSTDIGQYNTCAHLCSYCYANRYPAQAINNYIDHRNRNPSGLTISGEKIGGIWDLEDE
jgi:DNA repair photolyase